MKTRARRLFRDFVVLSVVAFVTSGGCSRHSDRGTNTTESSKVWITQPTTDSKITIYGAQIDLGGTAAIDAWSYDYRVEPNVRWINLTTGDFAEAAEHCDWGWFFGEYPYNHTWAATVPLARGVNQVRVEAYYSGSGTVVGADGITVIAK